MKIHVYKGGFGIVKKSGVGKAVEHQEGMLIRAGIPVTDHWREAAAVHINTVFPDSVFAACLAKLHGKKVVYYGHSTMEDFRNSFIGSNALAGLFRKWICFCYNLGDVILTPTEYSRSILKQYGIKKEIYAITNGVDTDFFEYRQDAGARFRARYGLDETTRVVISVGHLIRRKGILEFFAVAGQMPDTQFIWFGDTENVLLPHEIRTAIRKKPSNVTFAGYVGADDLRDAYCGADAFAFFSQEETEGIVVLEALACEIPVLVRDIPVYQGWLVDGKQVYKADSIEMYVKKLNQIFNNDMEHVIVEGRNTALEHSLSETGRQLDVIYRKAHIMEEINTQEPLAEVKKQGSLV